MLKFYDINSDYADYLRRFDSKIPYITYEKNDKFICGIVLNVNEISYYAPISSNKTIQRTNLPIYDKHGVLISTIRFCFMFPAPLSVLAEKDFSSIDKENKKYTDLLKIEFDYCSENENRIRQKAESIYQIGCNKNHIFNYTCCDFKELESAYLNYIKSEEQTAAAKQI